MFYVAYIKNKSPTEYTGIESYVAEKIEKEDISWFPINSALCIKKTENEQQGVLNNL